MLKKTLDAIALGGLHDHLQGGFFRYCIDQQWTVPHFEKMLYDQAWLLWSYSAAYKVLKEESYKKIADKLVDFLTTHFIADGLLYTAISSDVQNEEGASYLWTLDELKSILNPEEFIEFSRVYQLQAINNTQKNLYHLIKKREAFLDIIEQKLLKARNKRPQPLIDTKHLTSWNAITGIALLIAYRCTDNQTALLKAKQIFQLLTTKLMHDDAVFHSVINGTSQKEGFLEDYAAMLLFTTYMHEETGEHTQLMQKLLKKIQAFKHDDIWYESIGSDFVTIPANPFDYMLPTSSSIAQLALLRAQILNNQSMQAQPFKSPLQCDFLNISTLISNGIFNIIDTPQKIDWHHLPLNTIQRRGSTIKNYFGGESKEYQTIDALLNDLEQ